MAFDAQRGGSYTADGTTVWINDVGYTFTNAGLRYTVAHELGHVFGLHEAYLYDTGPPEGYECNPPVDSIMDMADIPAQGQVVGGCDGEVLWPRDISLVQDLYALSPATQITSTSLGSDMLVQFWDENWAESGYNVEFYWWSGSFWLLTDEAFHEQNVAGVDHYIQVPYEKPAGRPAGLYRMCGYTFSQEYGSQHPFCAPGQYLTSGLADAMELPAGDVVSASIGTSDPLGTAVGETPLSSFPTMGGTFVILSTGLALSAYAPNLEDDLTYVLDSLNNSQGNDLVQFTLQMQVPEPFICFAFDFAFYSEEYPEYVGSQYNDTFIAELGPPGAASTFIIFESEVNAPNNIAFDSLGDAMDVNSVFGFSANSGTTYDGVAGPLAARSAVVPGSQIELVFSIMDLGDSWYDSAVFLDNFRWTMDAGESCESGAVAADDDQDGIPNFRDNCPSVPNGLSETSIPGVGNQTNSDADNATAGFLRNGSPLPGDSLGDACDPDDDNDSWSDADEPLIGTDPLLPCSADRWPPDIDNNHIVNFQDLNVTVPLLFSSLPGPTYNARFDLYAPALAFINFQDLNALVPLLFQSCTAP